MKFSQIHPGQRFLYEGDRYLKVGPLTACREPQGKTRLIPRSAVVSPVDPGGGTPAPGAGVPVWLSSALDAYEQTLRALILPAGCESDGEHSVRLELALDAARQAFYDLARARDASGSE
jgi:hypothetical protein